MNTEKKSITSLLLKLFLLGLVFVTLMGLSLAAFLGYRYYERSIRPNLNNSRNNSEETQRTFTSDTVTEPSGSIVDLVKTVTPSVTTVVVKSNSTDPFTLEEDNERQGVGTGFFISEDGLLITNEHVVCDSTSPQSVSVVTSDNKSYDAQSIAKDPYQDIAILKVDLKGAKVKALKFANLQSKILPGQEVIAVGNPLGVNPGSVTRGIVSGLNRNVTAQGVCQNRTVQKDYEEVIQTDAAINSGNSGGPLLNTAGEVVGVNAATSTSANNISYAIPFQRVVRLLERYQKNNGKITLPFVGVGYLMIDQPTSASRGVPVGAYVRQVVADGPAAKAGIRRGDIITKLGDKPLGFSLQATLNQYFEPGQTIKVELYRPKSSSVLGDETVDGDTITVDLQIGER